MRTSVFFFVYKILLSIYAQIYNSSPTYRGRRILAIYYVKFLKVFSLRSPGYFFHLFLDILY